MTGRRLRLALWPAGLAIGLLALGFALAENPPEPALVLVLFPLLGWSFIAAGLIAWEQRPANRTGPLMTLVGFSFFLSALSTVDHPVPYTAGRVVDTLFFGFLIHLLL